MFHVKPLPTLFGQLVAARHLDARMKALRVRPPAGPSGGPTLSVVTRVAASV